MKSRLIKASLIFVDLCLAAYIVFVFCAFKKPQQKGYVCHVLDVVVEDASAHGFITRQEVKARIDKYGLNPKGKHLSHVSCRQIEEVLRKTPFVKDAQCYKTIDGTVTVSITQRLPVVRIKASNGADYYIDDKDAVMPKSDSTSDLIVATGDISVQYATQYVSPLASAIMSDELCRNLFQQIHITPTHGVELVPRVGNHIVYLGQLPESDSREERRALIEDFVEKKVEHLVTFYKYGLSKAGWNKYSEINLEFDNQIVCKKVVSEE